MFPTYSTCFPPCEKREGWGTRFNSEKALGQWKRESEALAG